MKEGREKVRKGEREKGRMGEWKKGRRKNGRKGEREKGRKEGRRGGGGSGNRPVIGGVGKGKSAGPYLLMPAQQHTHGLTSTLAAAARVNLRETGGLRGEVAR